MSNSSSSGSSVPPPVRVYARWRPTPREENGDESDSAKSVVRWEERYHAIRVWENDQSVEFHKTEAGYQKVYSGDTSNQQLFDDVVKPMIPLVMKGERCNFFAFGEHGSGKTHTVLGNGPFFDNDEDKKQLGLFYAAAKELFDAVTVINEANKAVSMAPGAKPEEWIPLLRVGVRFCTIVGNGLIDRFGNEAFSYDGETEDKTLFLCPTVRLYWNYSDFAADMVKMRDVVLPIQLEKPYADPRFQQNLFELEVLNTNLVSRYKDQNLVAKVMVDDRQSIVNYENLKRIATLDSREQWFYERRKLAWSEWVKYYKDVDKAAQLEASASPNRCLRGRLTFLDLAGSDILKDPKFPQGAVPISPDSEIGLGMLTRLALTLLLGQMVSKIVKPDSKTYNTSILTLLLNERLNASSGGKSAMICTLTPLSSHYKESINTLEYGGEVGVLANPGKRENQ